MKKTTQQTWQDLIKRQSQGDLSISDFCKQQKISTSCFYKYKAIFKVKSAPQANAFIKAERLRQSSVKIEPIKVQHGKTQIHLPITILPTWFAEFIKALA